MLHTCLVFLILPPALSPFLYLVSQLVWNAVSAFLGSSLFCFPPRLPSCFAAGILCPGLSLVLSPALSSSLFFPFFSQLGLGCCGRLLRFLLSFVSSSQESPLTRCCRVLVGKPALPECPSVGSQGENDDRLLKFPGNLIPLAYRSIWRISKSCVLSLPVTLVMSCRAPHLRKEAFGGSKDPKVFIGSHYFVHCGAVRRTK